MYVKMMHGLISVRERDNFKLRTMQASPAMTMKEEGDGSIRIHCPSFAFISNPLTLC